MKDIHPVGGFRLVGRLRVAGLPESSRTDVEYEIHLVDVSEAAKSSTKSSLLDIMDAPNKGKMEKGFIRRYTPDSKQTIQ